MLALSYLGRIYGIYVIIHAFDLKSLKKKKKGKDRDVCAACMCLCIKDVQKSLGFGSLFLFGFVWFAYKLF